MQVITRLKIGNDKHFFSIGPMELLQNIETFSSIRKATDSMGMSYTKALRILRTMEEELGFAVVISEKGGSNHGKTTLTEQGRLVLHTFQGIQADVSQYAEKLVKERFIF